MIYNFSEIKKQNDWLEDELLQLKKEHHQLRMTDTQLEILKKRMEETEMEMNKNRKKSGIIKCTVAAALVAGFMALPNTSASVAYAMGQIPVIGPLVEAVTFRDYKYKSDRNNADIRVPEIRLGDQAKNNDTQKKLENTTEEINTEIQKITDQLVKEFEDNLAHEEGYQDVVVNSEVLTATEDYFTLKLNCYQGAGSGYQFNYYYTIDLNTGKRLQLKDLFREDADYITSISKNIRKQMKKQMAEDENVIYWLDNEIREWNFKNITDETSFYLNREGNLVISFNEGDVAPMYMGIVEFEIPQQVLEGIRK
ncbi:MAG: RsiV family protein [Lachnospiraceae bacterium]|nr:RsiV family protein [Lachnospiraceae bacterium]